MIATLNNSRIACVILASGFGRRFHAAGGQDKLLACLDSGTSVLQQTLMLYSVEFKHVYLVLRPDQVLSYKEILSNFDNVKVLPNTLAEAGMSQSIVTAVRALPSANGWLFCLADMPYIKRSTVRDLIKIVTEDCVVTEGKVAPAHKIVQPTFDDIAGNPVYMSREYAPELLGLKGDIGARDIIANADPDSVKRHSVADPNILRDIDFPSDL